MKIEFQDFIKQLFIEHRNAKSISGTGLILLSLVYSLDNLFHPSRSELFGWNYSYFLFYLGIGLFLAGLSAMLLSNIWAWIKVVYYRRKYSVEKLDKKFHLISFSGTVFLFDNCEKTSHWISSWQTAEDLRFQLLWTYTDEKYEKGKIIELKSGVKVKLDEYTQKNRIHTGGIPGT